MKILKHIFKFGVVEGFAKGSNILLVAVVLPIIVTIENYGIISILIAIEALLTVFLVFQQPDIYIRFYSTTLNRTMQLYQSSTIIILYANLFVAIIIIALGFIPSVTMFDFPYWYIFLIFIGSLIQSNFALYFAHLRAKGKTTEYFFYRLLFQITKFIITVIVALVLRNALSYVLGFFISNVVITIVIVSKNLHAVKLFIKTFQYKILIRSHQFKQNFHIGLPIGISVIIYSLRSNIDRFFLNFYLSIEDVGIYNFAFSNGASPYFFIAVLSLTLLPHIYKSGEYDLQTRNRLNQYLGLGLISVISASLFIYFIIFPFLLQSVDPQYEQGRTIVLFAIGIQILEVFYFFCKYSFLVLKKVNIIVVALVISLVLKIGLNIILIPSQGINGAGMADIISQMVGLLIMLIGLLVIRSKFPTLYGNNIQNS